MIQLRTPLAAGCGSAIGVDPVSGMFQTERDTEIS
jgi:hypothetical protein